MNFRQSLSMIAVAMVVVALVGAANLVAQGKAARPTSVAVVDVQQVFNALDEKSTVEADITQQTEQLQKEEQDRQTELKALQADLGILAAGTPAYQETQTKLENKALEFQVWKQFNQRKLEREKVVRLEALYRKVVDAIGGVAKQNNYDIVMFKDSTGDLKGENQQQLAAMIQVRKVLYSNPDLDITDQITQKLNNEWNNRKK
ncbi:OmpH family outer membrane protein [Planctomycetales bacterium ZRK34]|nr:OmpH family outer membrane protein [Planctomycetales bacterium ZRK34]